MLNSRRSIQGLSRNSTIALFLLCLNMFIFHLFMSHKRRQEKTGEDNDEWEVVGANIPRMLPMSNVDWGSKVGLWVGTELIMGRVMEIQSGPHPGHITCHQHPDQRHYRITHYSTAIHQKYHWTQIIYDSKCPASSPRYTVSGKILCSIATSSSQFHDINN